MLIRIAKLTYQKIKKFEANTTTFMNIWSVSQPESTCVCVSHAVDKIKGTISQEQADYYQLLTIQSKYLYELNWLLMM